MSNFSPHHGFDNLFAVDDYVLFFFFFLLFLSSNVLSQHNFFGSFFPIICMIHITKDFSLKTSLKTLLWTLIIIPHIMHRIVDSTTTSKISSTSTNQACKVIGKTQKHFLCRMNHQSQHIFFFQSASQSDLCKVGLLSPRNRFLQKQHTH